MKSGAWMGMAVLATMLVGVTVAEENLQENWNDHPEKQAKNASGTPDDSAMLSGQKGSRFDYGGGDFGGQQGGSYNYNGGQQGGSYNYNGGGGQQGGSYNWSGGGFSGKQGGSYNYNGGFSGQQGGSYNYNGGFSGKQGGSFNYNGGGCWGKNEFSQSQDGSDCTQFAVQYRKVMEVNVQLRRLLESEYGTGQPIPENTDIETTRNLNARLKAALKYLHAREAAMTPK